MNKLQEQKLLRLIRLEISKFLKEESGTVTITGYQKKKVTKTFPNSEAYEKWREQNGKLQDDNPAKVFSPNTDYN